MTNTITLVERYKAYRDYPQTMTATNAYKSAKDDHAKGRALPYNPRKPLLGHGDVVRKKGKTYVISIQDDDGSGAPWENCHGHGPVSDWTSRDKYPGERVVSVDGRTSKRYYDFQEATKIAKRDGWGLGPDELAKLESRLGRKATRKEVVRQAVESDYEYLRAWCHDEWRYVGVMLAELPQEGFSAGYETVRQIADYPYDQPWPASLWGIESNAHEYIHDVALELFAEIPL